MLSIDGTRHLVHSGCQEVFAHQSSSLAFRTYRYIKVQNIKVQDRNMIVCDSKYVIVVANVMNLKIVCSILCVL